MTIDYDRLRTVLAGTEAGTPGVVHCTWTDVARELIRLHDGVEQVRDTCTRVATVCRSSNDPDAPAVASTYESVANALTRLLNGDTE